VALKPGPALRCAVVAVVVLAALKVAWVCDDAYITFRTVDNLLQGHGPVWNPGERVQAYTHPLWMGILALAGALSGELYYTSMGLGLGCTALAVWWLTGLAETRAALAPLLVLGASKCVAEYATSGLENSLSMVLVVGALSLARAERWRALGLVMGLMPLCRPDLGLVALPLLVLLGQRRAWTALGLAVAPLAAWTAFSVFYYASFVPNTALAKLGHGTLGAGLAQGLAYLWATARWDPVAAVAGAVGLWAGLRTGGAAGRLAAGGLLYLGFSVLSGGDFMAGRFHMIVVVIGVAGLVLRGGGAWWVGVALVAAAASPLGPWRTGPDLRHAELDPAGIADERGWYYDHLGLWPRWAAGRGAPQPGRGGEARVAVGEAVGLDGYMAGPQVHLVDVYGLCDPLLSRLPSSEERGRPGHWRRELPAGYVETLGSGENIVQDDVLAGFVEDLHAATRGPLLAPGRVVAVWTVATTLRLPPPAAQPEG
jgi:arabinofuranosyltransferase